MCVCVCVSVSVSGCVCVFVCGLDRRPPGGRSCCGLGHVQKEQVQIDQAFHHFLFSDP